MGMESKSMEAETKSPLKPSPDSSETRSTNYPLAESDPCR